MNKIKASLVNYNFYEHLFLYFASFTIMEHPTHNNTAVHYTLQVEFKVREIFDYCFYLSVQWTWNQAWHEDQHHLITSWVCFILQHKLETNGSLTLQTLKLPCENYLSVYVPTHCYWCWHWLNIRLFQEQIANVVTQPLKGKREENVNFHDNIKTKD